MFKLGHISDVHLSPLPGVPLLSLFSKRITGFVNWKFNRKNAYDDAFRNAVIDHMVAQTPDHLTITGDLTNLALRDEITNVKQWLSDLNKRFDSVNSISVIAGNHDAYVPGSLRRCLASWQDHITDDKTSPATHNRNFPILKRRSKVSLISCNSAKATLPFSARGFFNVDQADRLASILQEESGRFRVVMIHHPPFEGATIPSKQLVGIQLFQEVVRAHGCELVLHGHTHLATTIWIDGKDQKVPVIGVPATGQVPGSFKPPAGYNLFEIRQQGKVWSCQMKSYGIQQSASIGDPPSLVNDQKIL